MWRTRSVVRWMAVLLCFFCGSWLFAQAPEETPPAAETPGMNPVAEPAANPAANPPTPETAPESSVAAPPVAGSDTEPVSGKLLEKVKQFLDEDDWQYEQVDGRTVLRMGFQGEHGAWVVIAQTKEEDDQLLFYSVTTENVQTDKLAPVAEYLHRANYGLPIGCFELDFKDGEVRYKTALDVEGAELTQTQIKNYLYLNVITFDRYISGLNDILSGVATPEEAIKKIEEAKG